MSAQGKGWRRLKQLRHARLPVAAARRRLHSASHLPATLLAHATSPRLRARWSKSRPGSLRPGPARASHRRTAEPAYTLRQDTARSGRELDVAARTRPAKSQRTSQAAQWLPPCCRARRQARRSPPPRRWSSCYRRPNTAFRIASARSSRGPASTKRPASTKCRPSEVSVSATDGWSGPNAVS